MISMHDYEDGPEIADPTDPEIVDPVLMNTLAAIITYAEETLQPGEIDIDADDFYMRRGEFLDTMSDTNVIEWMTHMRRQGRAPFRRYRVKDDGQEET